MKRYLILFGVIICMSLSSIAQVCVFDLTTGTDVVGSVDPIWEVRTPMSVDFDPVNISTGALQSGTYIYPNAYIQNDCGRWISPHLNGLFNIVSSGAEIGIYTYQAVVNVEAPCGIDSARLTFDFMAADNSLPAVRVNDINYPPPPGITHITPGSMTTLVALDPGVNIIQVDVNNLHSYTGLQLCGELTVYKTLCPPDDLYCCDAPSGQVLTWAEVSGAIGYDIDFGFNDINSPCCENVTELPTGYMEFLTDNVFLLPDSFTACFWWRVRAVFPDGSKSEWSEKECDCLPNPCETPTELECSINSVGRVLSWTAVVGAISYDVMINYNDPACCPVGGGLPFSNMYSTTDDFYVVPGFNQCFSWRVRARCLNGGISEWSEAKCSDDCFFSNPAISTNEETTKRSSANYANVKTSVIPNPANDYVSITITDASGDSEINNATLIIFDITGKEVYKSSITSNESKQIDVSQFTSGIYLLKILDNGRLISSDKLVIQ